MKDETDTKLLATLKRHTPFKVNVYNGDDDVRSVAVPTKRRRWAQVIAAIEAKPWSRIELCDKSGAALAYLDNEGPARDMEELGPSFAGVGGQLLLGERIAALAVKTAVDALKLRDSETTTLLRAQGDVVRELTNGVRALAEVYREQNVAVEEAAEMRVAAAAEANGGDLKQLLEAMPVLLQALPILRSLVSGDAPTTPKNGARGGASST
jgi:hypothetical protein